MFWPPYFLGGETPEFLDLHYKIEPDSYRVAEFDGDRPRELGDLALKKKEKHHGHFISPPVTTYGRPNKYFMMTPFLTGSNESFLCFIFDV